MLLHVIVWMSGGGGGERRRRKERRKGESRGGKGRGGEGLKMRGEERRGGEGREKGFKGREWHYLKTITIIFLHSKPRLQTKSVLYAPCHLNRFLPVCQSNPTEINLSKALWGNRWLPEWLQDGIHEAGVPQVEETSCTHGTGVTILGEREKRTAKLLAIVVDRIFTSGNVDMHTSIFIDHHHTSLFVW